MNMVNNITDSTSAYDYLKSSPMFKFSLSSKELFHSNFLEWLSNVNSGDFKTLIKRMAGLGDDFVWPSFWRVKREYNNFDLCIVAYDQAKYQSNEDERIDDDEDFRIIFVIENKVKSIPYKEQLLRYSQEAESINERFWKKRGEEELRTKDRSDNEDKDPDYDWIGVVEGKWTLQKKTGNRKNTKLSIIKTFDDLKDGKDRKDNKTNFKECYAKYYASINPIRFILLSLAKTFPGSNDINKNVWVIEDKNEEGKVYNWNVCNYCVYKDYISKSFNGLSGGLNNQIIADYCDFIKSLTTLSSEWEKDYDSSKVFLSTNNDNYKNAKQFRIHDLYQKLKFSRLCTELFNQVKKKYGKDYDVFPSNQGGLFKEKEPSKRAFICVNYTFLHGDPLLEINIHPKIEDKGIDFYYAIQVQGNAYEHGIQVKKNEVAKLSNDPAEKRLLSVIVWTSLKDGTLKIIDGWMNVQNNSWGKQNWMNDTQNKDYNKYDMNDGTFVYQKYTIGDETKIETIIEQMLDDLKFIINNLQNLAMYRESLSRI